MLRRMLTIATLAASVAVAHAGAGIKGTVTFEGPAPERTKVQRGTDPYCARTEALSDDVIVTGGKLKDVLVRIKVGSLPVDRSGPTPPALIDQKNCAYSPRVIGVREGQPIAVRNSDGTFHNVHGTIAGKPLWNKPAMAEAPDLTLDNPAKPGDVIDVVCDVHPWMHAYAVVVDHAVFAVTGEDGAFELPALPPGTYTVEAWHPRLGLRTAKVKLGKATATVTLSYRAGDVK